MAILSPALKAATARDIEPYLNQISYHDNIKAFMNNIAWNIPQKMDNLFCVCAHVVKLLLVVQNKTELDLAVEKTSNKTLLEFQP